MQLQIQTSIPSPKPNPAQNHHEQLPSIKDLFSSPKTIFPSQDLLSQLRQIQLTANADFHYLTRLRKKAFSVLYEEDYEAQVGFMEKGFLALKFCRTERKRCRIQGSKFIENLIRNNHFKKQMKQKSDQAVTFYERGLLRKVFSQVFSMIKIQKKQEILRKYLKKHQSIDFIELLKEASRQTKNQRLENEQAQTEVDKIYKKKLYKKVFSSWILFNQSVKLQKFLKFKALQRLIRKLIEDKKQTISIIEQFKESQAFKQKRRVFDYLKEAKLQSQCRDWYKYRLQKLCFKKWLQYHEFAQQEKQIEQSNEVILKHFLEEKEPTNSLKLKIKYFRFWKSWVLLEKESKKETELMKSFAQLKQKQYLERKYFLILKQNRNYEKSIRFNSKKLKQKVLESLRRNLISESKKLENVLKFIQKRTIGKYFHRIKLFNEKQISQINKYLLQKIWLKFTLKITIQYLEKTEKAQIYYETSLKFKAMFAFKKNVEIQKKTQFCAFNLSIIKPLKRWNQRFRLRKWIECKEFYSMKRIFFEWKLITIRKMFSKEKEAFVPQLFVESRIDSRKSLKKVTHSVFQLNDQKNRSSQITQEEISFFRKMDENSSSDQSDHVTKKVDSLLTKIKTKKIVNKNQSSELERGSGFSNERLIFANRTFERSKIAQTNDKLRLPTWSSPGNDYRVSVFSQDAQD